MYNSFLTNYNNTIMNQILFTKKDRSELKKYRFLLILSLVFIILFSIYELYVYNIASQKEKFSEDLLTSFYLEKLYSSADSNYTIVKLNEKNSFSVIGIIEIPKISINYPILSSINDELLKISPCRFYGPYPNEIGNLCIAAHNYDDNRFFGNLDMLQIDDKINIYDSNNYLISYFVYDKFEIMDSDISCTNQNTHGQKEITLVTCNNINKKRLVIKAKEK